MEQVEENLLTKEIQIEIKNKQNQKKEIKDNLLKEVEEEEEKENQNQINPVEMKEVNPNLK